jgi:hypothetical protein
MSNMVHAVVHLAEALCFKAGRSRVWFTKKSLDLFNLPNPSSSTMVLGSTQTLERNNRELR